MNFQALEVFCQVVRRRSFSRGAASLGISQSAASQVVAHLESELGFQLIDRRRRPLEPTSAGRLYYQGCQEMLHQHRAVLEKIHNQQKVLGGSVRVASIYSAGLHTLTRYIRRFLSLHGDSNVRLEYFHPVKVYSAILEDEADLGVISYPRPHRDLHVIPWVEEEMVLACPPNHPLARKERISLADLDGETFVAFDPELKIRREIDRRLRKRQIAVKVVSDFDNIETIKQALEISSAVSILPASSIEREVQRNSLLGIPIHDLDLRRPVGVIHKRRRQLTPTAARFLGLLLDGRGQSSQRAR